jgi:4-carboxymuconolactone decarboxylase
VFELCAELLHDRDVSDKTFAAAMERFGETTVLELVSLAAYYGFVSLILNVNRTPIPDSATPLPPMRAP